MIALLSVAQGEGHGAEVVLEHMLRRWEAEPLTLLCPPGSRIERVGGECGMPCIPLGRNDRLLGNLYSVVRAGRGLRDCRLVHGWTARGFESAWWLGGRLGVPVTATLHDHPCASFHGSARRWLMRAASARMAAVAAVSGAVVGACREAGWRVPMEVLRNGLADRPRSLSPSSVGVRIGFLGMYAAGKGFPLVEGWIRRTAGLDVCWRLYGDVLAEYRVCADRLAAEFPVRVVVEGRRLPEEIFDGIEVLVHTSTGFDSLPTVLIEAARAGIPAVASARGGAAEIVEDGKTGFLFDPDAPQEGLAGLERLIADANLRRRMGAAARAVYEARFGIGCMTAAYAEFWSKHAAV